MTVRTRHSQPLPSAAAAVALLLSAVGLGGCAGMSDGISTAFADPAKYDLYDCKQLETARKELAARQAELQGLMTKAETGTGGVLVAELAYRNEFIAVRGQSTFAEEAWQRNRCQVAAPAAAAAPTPPVVAPAPTAKGARASQR